MKRLYTPIICVIFLTACSSLAETLPPTDSPVQAGMLSPTLTETLIPTQTHTATEPPEPTPTHTLLPPTPSSTSTNTPTPTLTPVPVFFWTENYDNPDWSDNYFYNQRGGRYSVEADPTGNNKEMVLKCEAAPELAYLDRQYYNGEGTTVIRSYPAKYFPAIRGPHLVGLDVYVMDNFYPNIDFKIELSDDEHKLSLLSDFYDTESYGRKWGVAATANLTRKGNKYYLYLENVREWRAEPYPAAPVFTLNQWHRIEILVTRQRKVILYQDGQIVTEGTLADGVPIATAGGHPGLYGLSGEASLTPPFQTGTLYNDNWTIIVWPP